MTFTAGGMKGKYLPLSLSLCYSSEDAPSVTEEGQKSGDLPANKGESAERVEGHRSCLCVSFL